MSDGVVIAENRHNDNDWSALGHAVLMSFAFLCLFPLGIFALRVLEKVIWHAWIQGIAVVISISGGGLGVYVGFNYNRVCP